MISKSARKGHSHRPGILASGTNRNPWVKGMLLFGAFTLAALFSFELIGGQAFAQSAAAKKTVLDALMDAGFVGLIIILMSIVGGALSITFAFQLRRDVLVEHHLRH